MKAFLFHITLLFCAINLPLQARSDTNSIAALRAAAHQNLQQENSRQALLQLQKADSLERAQLQKQSNHALAARELENQHQLEQQALQVMELESSQQKRKLWIVSGLAFVILLGGTSIYILRSDAHRKKKVLLKTKSEKLRLEESILRNQMEKRSAEKELLEQELSENSLRQTSFHNIIEEQNQASQKLRELLKSYRSQVADIRQRETISELNLQMVQQSQRNRQLERFQTERGKLPPETLQQVHQHYKHLKGAEIKLLIYILNDLSISEIAEIYQLQPESINKRRYRLRKKLGVPRNSDFKEFILGQINPNDASA